MQNDYTVCSTNQQYFFDFQGTNYESKINGCTNSKIRFSINGSELTDRGIWPIVQGLLFSITMRLFLYEEESGLVSKALSITLT
jgi:hypothetical protein